jgi:hypothetical protein
MLHSEREKASLGGHTVSISTIDKISKVYSSRRRPIKYSKGAADFRVLAHFETIEGEVGPM